MFEGFRKRRIYVSGVKINMRTGGSGPPLLLLHGYPQTHVCWHLIAPILAKSFSLVVPDLRGYGDSSCPDIGSDGFAYSKRVMALDMVALMKKLGYDAFSVIGHDRGARVAYRMGLDHSNVVDRIMSLDVVPTFDMWQGTDKKRAIGAFHWSFLAQPSPLPERLIQFDPEFFATRLMTSWAAPGFEFKPDAMAEYLRCFVNPEVIRATCEDYRAGAGIDDQLDREDFEAGRRLKCPVHFLWGSCRNLGGPQGSTEPLQVWRRWADNVSGGPIDCGHFLAEESPEQVIDEIHKFFVVG